MRRILVVCRAAVLAAACVGWAGAQQVGSADSKSGTPSQGEVQVNPPRSDLAHVHAQGVDVLSDTQGVDFKPYLNGILKQIYGRWVRLMPEEARPPQNKQGVTNIRFTINPDGTIAAMHLDESAKDAALDRAAWGAITGIGKFAALPKEFRGPDLELRIHFRVNGCGDVSSADKTASNCAASRQD